MTNLRTCALDLEKVAVEIEDDRVVSKPEDVETRDRIVRRVRRLAVILRALDKRLWS